MIFLGVALGVAFSSFNSDVLAQDADCPEGRGGYCMLSPIFADDLGERVEMADYLMRIYNALFLTAGIAATVILIWGGFQYMISETGGKKSEAISMMQNAVYGLLLAMFSYTILYTINPNLLKVNFQLRPIRGLNPVVDPLATTTPPGTWGTDEAERARLASAGQNGKGIDVKEPTCTEVGQQGCTSVYRLSSRVDFKLMELENMCEARRSSCEILITGGTEYWLHSGGTAHRPGNAVVDLRKSNGLDSLIRTGVRSTTRGCSELGAKFEFMGGTYVDEGDHWHACL